MGRFVSLARRVEFKIQTTNETSMRWQKRKESDALW